MCGARAGWATFSLQTGELWFEVDAAGENAYAVVGEHTFVLDGPTLVRGLPPGSVRVFLSAEGRRSAIVEVEVPSQGGARSGPRCRAAEHASPGDSRIGRRIGRAIGHGARAIPCLRRSAAPRTLSCPE